MAPAPLDRFFEPERIVAIVSNGDRETSAGAKEGSTEEPWEFPGVETVVFEPDHVSEISFTSGDLAVVETPTGDQEAVLRTIYEGPVQAVLLSGGEPGADLPDGLETAIQQSHARILGPGACVEVPSRAGGSLAGTGDEAGAIAVLAADRYVGRSIAAWTASRGMRLGPVVGVGAEIDVNFGEMAAAMAERASTDLVLGRSPVIDATAVEAFRGADFETPVAVYPGAGNPLETGIGVDVPGKAVSRSLLEQAGMVNVESLERMIDGGPALATQPLPDPESVVVVSNAGGPGVMGIDAVGASGLDVARLSDETVARLENVLPEHGSARNPLDLLADSGIDVFEAALDVTLEDQNVGAAVVMSAPSAIFAFEELAEVIVDARRRHELPIVTALMGGSRTDRPAAVLREAGIPNYFDPYRAVGALDLLRRQATTVPRRRRAVTVPEDYDEGAVAPWLPADGDVTLVDDEAASFVHALGVEDVVSAEAVPDSDGVELFVTGHRCPERGPVLATGVSTFARAVGDASIRGVPLGQGDADEMIDSLRAAPVLKGARGRDATNTAPVRRVLLGLSTLFSREPSVGTVSLPSVTVAQAGLRIEQVVINGAPDRGTESRG